MKVTYYELDQREIGKETEKAIGIITGTGANTKATYKYIAKSLIKEVETKLYIPTWIVKQECLWDYIKEENQIQMEDGKKRVKRTNEQILQDNILETVQFNREEQTESYFIKVNTGNDVQSNTVRNELSEKKINRMREEGLNNIDKIAVFYINNNKIDNYLLNELDSKSQFVYDYIKTLFQ
jgi:hypothetical protein